MDVEQLLGWNVERIRRIKGISQKELALRLLTFGQGDLSRLEDGRLNPTARTLYRIAEALESTVGDLFQTEGLPQQIADAPNIRKPKSRNGRSLEIGVRSTPKASKSNDQKK
jgi:transcriptional regulator with XRE-family HTH domain